MSLAIKKDTDIEQLRAFGFALGEELAERPDFANYFIGREYQLSWWHKCNADRASDTGAPDIDEDGNPTAHAWVDTRDGKNLLWFDVVPCCTYHAGMSDLNLVTDTVFALTQAGLVEEV